VPSDPLPVFCAIADRSYFLGAVALVNSLRLTGNAGEIAFLDVGLEPAQRALLEQQATIHDGPAGAGWVSVFAKPQLGLLHTDRVVVLLDNDMVVTGSLEPLVRSAAEGKIAVFAEPDPSRWFSEWQEVFSLRQPLRKGRYVNGACVALSTATWRAFLERWLELGESVSAARSTRPFLLRRDEVVADPVGFNEQDTLNALLMSEVPEDAVDSLPRELAPVWADRHHVRVVDAASLRCSMAGTTTLLLHSTGVPKPWHRRGWLRRHFRAFDRLFTRAVTGADAPVRLSSRELPHWLRPGPGGRLLALSATGASLIAHGAMTILPAGLRARLVSPLRARFSGTTARA
jgi:hypothetical protein